MWQNYLKIAYKVLLRRKFFTAISLFCISFTLVVLMVVAALLDHAFAPLPPEVNAARSLRCSHMELKGPESRMSGQPGYAFLDRYVRTLPGTEAVTVFSHIGSAVSYLGDRKIVSQQRRTDAVYWRIHHFRFLEGGPFSEQDDRDGNSVAVINAATRRRFFGDGVQALDRNLELDGQTFRIIGVVEDVPRYRETGFADVWVPIGSNRSERYRTELMGDFEAVVLAKRRADRSRIQADFTAMLPRVEITNPEIFKEMRGVLRTYPEARAMGMFPGRTDTMNSRFREFILALVAGALLFMWLPAMNLININLSRILERSSEIGVRKAFGASSWTLVGQFVLENVLLCLIGGVIALVLSALVLRGIETLGLLPYAHLRLNLRIFAIGLGLASFFGVLSGVYPAWRMSRMHPVLALRGGVS